MDKDDNEPNVVEKAKADAMKIRYDNGTPVRVFLRKGMVIWSNVDDQMRDLTAENSEGLLFTVRSVFVPHGEQNPLTALSDQTDRKAVLEEAARNEGFDRGTIVAASILLNCWGSDIEQVVQSIWLQLDCLEVANRAEVNPHRKGLIECREKLDALLRNEA